MSVGEAVKLNTRADSNDNAHNDSNKIKGRRWLLTGSPRGGTTWLARTLAHHYRFRLLYEPFRPNPQTSLRYEPWPFRRRGQYLDISEANEEYLTAVEKIFSYRMNARALLDGVKNHQFSSNARQLASLQAARIKRLSPFVKDTWAKFMVPWLYVNFRVKPIFLIRHPAGVAAGWKRLNWSMGTERITSQPTLIEGPLHPIHGWIQSWPERLDWLEAAAFQFIATVLALKWAEQLGIPVQVWSFEHLASEPNLEIPRAARLAGLGEPLRPFVEPVSGLTGRAPSHDDQRQHILNRDSKTAVDSWRERLTVDEVGRLQALVGAYCSRFYDKQGDW